MKIKDIMTVKVISVTPLTKVSEIAKILGENRIGAVPVLDDEKRVVGIISESDLFLKEKGIPFSVVKIPHLFNEWVEPTKLEALYRDIDSRTASDVMTSPVITVQPDDDIGAAAELMYRNKISRLPVVKEGVLVGIVSRADIIRLLATN